MTLVAAYVGDDATHMIADTYSYGGDIRFGGVRKIEKRTLHAPNGSKANDILIGSAGEASTTYIARNFTLPTVTKGADPDGVADRIAAAIQQFGADSTGGINYHGGSDQIWLIAYGHHLYSFIHYDVVPMAPYGAIGAGSELAMGALSALSGLPAKEALYRAADIAAEHSHLVTAPFTYEAI